MSTSTSDIRQELQIIEAYLARLGEHVARVEGQRDKLVLQLSDSDGQHDRRFAGVR